MPEPRPRTPAQIEASRRNGSRSHGPLTPEGKARASRNAVKHGLTAMTHLVVEGEDPAELEALTFRMLVETGATSEIEARIARRLAIAFWKGERAEWMEAVLLNAAPKIRPPAHGYQWEAADPLTTFDLKRFNAVRGAQAQIGREIKSCLKELRQLRDDPLTEGTDESEASWENEPDERVWNEPGTPPPANDDLTRRSAGAVSAAENRMQNKPEPWPEEEPVPPRVAALHRAIQSELAVRREDPERGPAVLNGLLERLWVERMGLAEAG